MLLLDQRADTRAADAGGWAAIHEACHWGDVKAVKVRRPAAQPLVVISPV